MFKPKFASKEYQKSMLPQTRKEVFFDVVKLHWVSLLLCGVIILLFSLPLHATAIIGDLYSAQISSQVNTGAITVEKAAQSMASFDNTLNLIDIFLMMVFAIGFSGIMHIMRQYAWEENVFFGKEFIRGIRQNVWQMILIALITGVIRYGCKYIYNMLALSGNDAMAYVGYLPMAWCAIILAPPAAYTTVTTTIYGNKLFGNFKIGLMLYFKRFFKTVLAVIICAVPFVVQIIPNFYCHIFGRLMSSMITPFIILGWTLFTYEGLDKTINQKQYPQLVGKGTFRV